MLATSEGREYPALTAKSRLYDLGQGFMPKAFDDALLGLTVGQTAACDLKVPIADDASTASSDEGETKYRDVHVEMRVEGIYSDDVSTVGDEWIAAHFPESKAWRICARGFVARFRPSGTRVPTRRRASR